MSMSTDTLEFSPPATMAVMGLMDDLRNAAHEDEVRAILRGLPDGVRASLVENAYAVAHGALAACDDPAEVHAWCERVGPALDYLASRHVTATFDRASSLCANDAEVMQLITDMPVFVRELMRRSARNFAERTDGGRNVMPGARAAVGARNRRLGRAPRKMSTRQRAALHRFLGVRRDLIRTGMLHARAEHLRAIERYLYRASMRSRAGGLEQAIHGPPSPDDFGIPTAHLVTATVAPSHAGPLAR